MCVCVGRGKQKNKSLLGILHGVELNHWKIFPSAFRWDGAHNIIPHESGAVRRRTPPLSTSKSNVITKKHPRVAQPTRASERVSDEREEWRRRSRPSREPSRETRRDGVGLIWQGGVGGGVKMRASGRRLHPCSVALTDVTKEKQSVKRRRELEATWKDSLCHYQMPSYSPQSNPIRRALHRLTARKLTGQLRLTRRIVFSM